MCGLTAHRGFESRSLRQKVDSAPSENTRTNGERAGALISRSISTALDGASTTQAIQAVIDRLNALGAAGQLTGQQLAAGLDAARAKLDDIKAGISSTDEALRAFGLQTRGQLQQTAETLGEAWDKIRNDATVSLADQRRAFEQWAEAATAANRGIEPSFVTLQRRMLETREAAAGLGQGISDAMGHASARVDALIERFTVLSSASAALDERNRSNLSVLGDGSRQSQLAGQNAVDNRLLFDLLARQQAGTLGADDLGSAQAVRPSSPP